MVIDVKVALQTGEMSILGRLVDASNATLLVTVDDGFEGIKCIYKPIAGERPLWDFPHGTLAYREYAAFLLSDEARFDVVPLTILRSGPYGDGAVQQWIDIDESIDLVELFKQDIPELRKMALFDAVINNTDRKIGHLLPTSDGRIRGCDHGVTFHSEDKLRTVLWQWAGSAISSEEETTLTNLLELLKGDLGSQLDELLTQGEVRELYKRVELLLEMGVFPLPNPDWPAVPWPPF
jgi:uncharacterized repeat protein (TIGR03843 family)